MPSIYYFNDKIFECGLCSGSVENAECGVRGVENEECEKWGVWKMRSVEKCGVWKMSI